MAIGLLRIKGTLSTSQFWPSGESDGDTAKVAVTDDSFAFRSDPHTEFRTTRVFQSARVRGRVNKPVIDRQGRIDIRFQGIDAPELHFRPTFNRLDEESRAAVKAVNKNFRQRLGATAGARFGKLLARLGENVPCQVITAVDAPNEVCDTYARVVGDIPVTSGARDVDLNLWMIEQGWAFPAFYTSMSSDEITQLLNLAQRAKRARRGIWKFITNRVTMPDFSLVFSAHEEIDLDSDTGPVLFPKFFRRSCNWAVAVKAGLVGRISFATFLSQQSEPDACFLRDELLTDGMTVARQHRLQEFVEENGTVSKPPEDLVFNEAKSTLVDARGQRVREF
jgi:endonuclease YncB( thermonuclease family)